MAADAVKFDPCNNLPSSVHTILVIILHSCQFEIVIKRQLLLIIHVINSVSFVFFYIILPKLMKISLCKQFHHSSPDVSKYIPVCSI